MFAKLLKYEWRDTWRQLGILSLAALLTGFLGGGLVWVLRQYQEGEMADVVFAVSMMVTFFLILGVCAYMIGASIVLYYRFYRSKFTDEGYLAFTLPVKPWQLFLSSLLNICIWSFLVMVVAGISIGFVVLVNSMGQWKDIMEVLSDSGFSVTVRQAFGNVPVQILMVAVSFVAGNVLVLSCITLGASLAKKHKLLTAVGLYYGVSMLQSTVSSVLLVVVLSGLTAEYNVAVNMTPEMMLGAMNRQMTANSLVQMAVQAALALGGYFLSVNLMKRKLNLP